MYKTHPKSYMLVTADYTLYVKHDEAKRDWLISCSLKREAASLHIKRLPSPVSPIRVPIPFTGEWPELDSWLELFGGKEWEAFKLKVKKQYGIELLNPSDKEHWIENKGEVVV